MKKTLSICIATYNRKDELKELVEQILSSDNPDFMVEITDNCSTDGTVDMLEEINDSRIVIHRNKHNIGGHNNMVRSIFNSSSKYALYLNDRELFDSSKLEELIDFLKNCDCAYLYCTRRHAYAHKDKQNATLDIEYYEKGLDSFQNQGYAHHPSGMTYNSEMIRQYLKYDDYIELDGNFKFSMVACDLMALGKTAKINIGIWFERSEEFIQSHVSGFESQGLNNPEKNYFHPFQSEIDAKCAIKHIVIHPIIDVHYSKEEVIGIVTGIVRHHYMTLLTYKPIMHSTVTCGHYKLRRTFVTTGQMIKFYKHYYNSNLNYIQESELPDEIIRILKANYVGELQKIIVNSIKNDIAFILRK